MKKIVAMGLMVVVLASCGGALDGDAKTDTTAMPVDTNLHKSTQEIDHINRTDGTKMADTTGGKKGDSAMYN